MNNLPDSSTNEYITPITTETTPVESVVVSPETEVYEKEYGINKPQRIVIRAKITHD
jgi:hypothetical protein